MEAALEDALDRITYLEQEYKTLEEREEKAEFLFVETWWLLKEIDSEAAERFKEENPDVEVFI